ncbi:hypothetical protein OAJ93_00495 [Gammaproteobacteria bacterium]|nr:hypothetical protein [Gammaproteobacteria bacterium]
MPTFLNTLIAEGLVLSIFGTIILTGLIYFIGRNKSGVTIANASVGVTFAWFCALVLGTPDFPPEFNNTAILSATVCLLIIGVILDFSLIKRKKFPQIIIILIILLSGFIVTIWMRSGIDVWFLPVLLGWSITAISLHRISTDAIFSSGNCTFILIIASLGTGIIAWISNIVVDRDLAFGLCAISIGFFICNLVKSDLKFGYSILLAGGGSLYILTLRLVEQMPSLISAFIILAFVFFADIATKYVQENLKLKLPIPTSINLFVLALFPLALATVITLIANEFPVS